MFNKLQEIDYSKLPEADVLIHYIVNRYRKGLYSLVLTGGLPGTGKTRVDFRATELIADEGKKMGLKVNVQIIDKLLDLVRFVKNAKEVEMNLGIAEEISVLFPSRRAMSGENVAIGKILDVARKKKVIILANAPLWTSIDSHIRAMGCAYIETLRIIKTHNLVLCKFFRLQTNPSTGKIYTHLFKREGREVQRAVFKKSNDSVWK
jgi:hypothetical protein